MRAGARFVVVRLAGREFAVPAWRVCGMMQLRGLHVEPVEGLGAMRYLASFHGRALPVYVPNGLLGLEERPVSARSCLLLIRNGPAQTAPELDAGGAHCALMVDSVSRLEDIPAAACRRSDPAAPQDPEQVRLGDKWRRVIDVEQICRRDAQAVRSRMT
jgi:hypothetical protein